MARVNVTIDDEMMKELQRLAKGRRGAVAAVTRDLIAEAIARRKRIELERKMAADHAAGSDDPEERALIAEATAAGDEILSDDEAWE